MDDPSASVRPISSRDAPGATENRRTLLAPLSVTAWPVASMVTVLVTVIGLANVMVVSQGIVIRPPWLMASRR
jgi:hypothetical protein